MANYLRTVHIEPPVTDEVLLVEKCSIRTEKAVLGQVFTTKISTNMKSLALSLRVSIISLYEAITQETSVRRAGIYGIVFTRGPRDGGGKGL